MAYHELLAICVEAIKELDQKASLTGELLLKIDEMNQIINDLQTKITAIDQSSVKEKDVNVRFYNDGSSNYEIKLLQNRPNPYAGQTEIECLIPQITKSAFLLVSDLNGKQLKSIEIKERGKVVKTISASELRPGMYLYSLVADNRLIDTKTMVLTER